MQVTASHKSELGLLFCAVYLLSAAYLAVSVDPSLFYVANVLLHLLGGVGLGAALAWYLPSIWRSVSRWGHLFLAMTLVGFTLGFLLLWTGATRPFRSLLFTHIVLSILGPVGLAGLHEVRRFVRERLSSRTAVKTLAYASLHSVWVVSAVGLLVTALSGPAPGVENPIDAPLTMEEETAFPSGPFFPSAAETAGGGLIPADFFSDSASCGASGCHPDIFKQWQSSAHHLASFNNQWYRKSVEYMQDMVGVQPSKWCGGCHDHALLFSGMMDTPVKELIDRPESHVGLGCVSCHSITHVKNTMGNGGFVIEYPPLHRLATSSNRLVRRVHDYLTKVDPGPHRSIFLKPLHTEHHPEFCSSCHKVHLDVPVNHHRWIRGFNEYDAWQGSGVSGQSARAFYYPDEPMACNDCHMPLVPSQDAGNRGGMVHSHRFAAANTALPTANSDEEQLVAVRQMLQANAVTVDILAVARGGISLSGTVGQTEALPDPLQIATTFPEPDQIGVLSRGSPMAIPELEIEGPLDGAPVRVRPGESIRIEVVVRTRTLGHFFPGGTVDAFDVWVALKAEDETGRVFFLSGGVEDGGSGAVHPDAHFYRSLQLDGRGNPINKRNAWASRSLMYVRLIPPGAADSVHYRLDIPQEARGTIKITAKVNYRKFSWWNTQWSFAGVRDPEQPHWESAAGYDDGQWVFSGDTSRASGKLKSIPDLPILVLAEDEVRLEVTGDQSGSTGGVFLRKEDLIRWNDYGIGLLLQGDYKGAARAFTTVTEIDPAYADGWVNLARVAIEQGDPSGALEYLGRVLETQPGLAKANYFAGLALKSQGLYDEALSRFRLVLAQYPKDKVVRNQAGRVLFLQRRFGEAVAEFHESLRVDPENLQAHYNLMLCYRGLGDTERAQREEKLYLRYKADEASQEITGDYRRIHAEDNHERQQIHEHRSGPLP